jgi:hypothetical protein
MKRIELLHIYYSYNKPMKHFEKREHGGRNGKIMEGLNLLKVNWAHVWNYHKETPLVYDNSKIKF